MTLRHEHSVIELGMALLAIGQLRIKHLKIAFCQHAALLQRRELSIHLSQIEGDLLASQPHLLGDLGQSQNLDLQLMGPALTGSRFATTGHQGLRGIRVGGFAAQQR